MSALRNKARYEFGYIGAENGPTKGDPFEYIPTDSYVASLAHSEVRRLDEIDFAILQETARRIKYDLAEISARIIAGESAPSARTFPQTRDAVLHSLEIERLHSRWDFLNTLAIRYSAYLESMTREWEAAKRSADRRSIDEILEIASAAVRYTSADDQNAVSTKVGKRHASIGLTTGELARLVRYARKGRAAHMFLPDGS